MTTRDERIEADRLATRLDVPLAGSDDDVDLNLGAVIAELSRPSALAPDPEAQMRIRHAVATALPQRRTWKLRPFLIVAGVGTAAVLSVVALLVVTGVSENENAHAASLLVQEQPGDPAVTFLGGDPQKSLSIDVDSFGNLFLSWSPDGRSLAYVHDADIWILDESGARHNLTSSSDRIDGFPRWSPKGDSIAFASRSRIQGEDPERLFDSPGALSIMKRDGSGYKVIGTDLLTAPPSWSGNGRSIAYSSAGVVHVWQLATAMEETVSAADVRLPADGYLNAPEWSPKTDEFVVYYSVTDQSPSREQVLTKTAPRAEQGYLLVSGDRKAEKIFTYDGTIALGIAGAEWSANGNRVLLPLGSTPASGNESGVWIFDTSARELVQLYKGAFYQAEMSPSGDAVALVDNTLRRLVVLDSSTKSIVREANFGTAVQGISWRPS